MIQIVHKAVNAFLGCNRPNRTNTPTRKTTVRPPNTARPGQPPIFDFLPNSIYKSKEVPTVALHKAEPQQKK